MKKVTNVRNLYCAVGWRGENKRLEREMKRNRDGNERESKDKLSFRLRQGQGSKRMCWG